MAEVRNAVGADAWKADDLGNWGLGGFRKFENFGSLEGSGDWEIRESVKSGGLEKIIICGKK